MSERGQFADRSEPLRLAILQRVVTPYRVALFRRLSAEPNLDLRVFADSATVEVFGENGKHARSAVGMGSLPGQIPVEIEMIVEVE